MVYATVQSRDGRLVPGLTKDDFEVHDEGRPAPITVFSSDPQPITVAVLLDMSGSMESHFLRVREATRHLIDALAAGDRARIGTFGAEVALSPHLTGDKRILQRVLAEELWPGGRTPLWEAVVAAMRSLDRESGRRVVLAVTDGFDSDDGPVGEARRRAERDGFMIYAIGLEGSLLEEELLDLAERTGGGHFVLERNAELTAAMTRVIEELRHQYLIGFSPGVADGRMHRLQVRVNRERMSVRARRQYRAPEKS